MTRPVCFQIYISHELDTRIREAAAAKNLSMSEWARSLLNAACDDNGTATQIGGPIERIARQSVFAMVGIDALLAGHSDPHLRERAHQAYARKCRELGLATLAERSGSGET